MQKLKPIKEGPKRYTKEEDEVILNSVSSNSNDLSTAFKTAAHVLNRTEAGVSFRYHKYLKTGLITKTGVVSKTKKRWFIEEEDTIILECVAANRTNLTLAFTKAARKLKRQYNSVYNRYNGYLKNQESNNIKTVQPVIKVDFDVVNPNLKETIKMIFLLDDDSISIIKNLLNKI